MSRLRHSTRLAAGVLGFVTTISVAFFIGSYLGDGSHTGTAGSGGNGSKNVPVKVNFPDAELTPQHAVPVSAEVENTATQRVTFHNVVATVTSSAPGCQASWFEVKAVKAGNATPEEVAEVQAAINGAPITGSAYSYPPGETMPMVRNQQVGLQLVLKETGTDQSACEGAPVTLRFQLS